MAIEKRLIDANALKDKFLYLRKMWSETENVLTINDAKTVDAVEVVHGRWIEHTFFMTCSVCHKDWDYGDNNCGEFDFCPNCGAKMDGKA